MSEHSAVEKDAGRHHNPAVDDHACPACKALPGDLRLPDNGRWVVKRGIQVFVMDEEAA